MNDTKELSYYYEELGASKSFKDFEKHYYDFLTKTEDNKADYKYSEGSYIDPDDCESVKITGFYNHLTCFLNHQEKKYKNSYLFLPPNEAPLTTTKEKDIYEDKLDDKKITVIQNGEVLFRLTSDQFGFSAKETIYKSNKYPLANLLRLSQNENQNKQKEIKELIARYVKNTRTMGGSFLWSIPPKEKGTRKCYYNIKRGKCLEDRVDLTLLEIKHALDGSYDNGEFTSDTLYNEYRNEKTYMKQWLKNFDSFDEYVEYFMFEPFVKDSIPINIVNGEPLNEDYIKKNREQYNMQHVQNLAAEEIRAMLERLESMILKRSVNMENVIKTYYEESHG